MKRVCLISTVDHNVGDDFVRAGIVWLLRQLQADLAPVAVHKHFPVSVRGRPWILLDRFTRFATGRPHWRTRLSNLTDRAPLNPSRDQLLTSDLVVQCGAPVYWKNAHSKCSEAEWFAPLIERRWLSIRQRALLLNLGAGSCQPWGSDGAEISSDPDCRAFVDKLTSWAALTTVRDALAREILRQCGHDAPLLPCPSIFAPQAAGVLAQPPEFLALNYMPAAGHYDLAGHGPSLRSDWERTFCATAAKLAQERPCLLICHDRAERDEARRLLPELPIFYSPRWQDYLNVYARCQGAIVNRVHGAVVTAALGKPVVLIGNDTRLLTAAEVPGIRVLPVTEQPATLVAAMESLASAPPGAPAAFLEQARRAYLELLQPLLSA